MDDKYICFEGTKQEIADQIGDKLCFPATDNLSKGYQDFQKIFIDLLMVNHTSLLSAEEEFQIQCPQNNAGESLQIKSQ